jgi:serine protease AprX
MKKLYSILLMVIIMTSQSVAQSRYVIFFTDKNNSPYSVSSPSAFLSTRAIDRRANQGIAVTPHDFPVNPVYVTGLLNAGAQVINTSRWFNSATVLINDPAVLGTILTLPYVSDWKIIGRTASGTPVPSKFSDETLISKAPVSATPFKTSAFNYGSSYNQVAMLKGDIMHQNGYTGEGMVIAVLDAGFPGVDNLPAFDSLRNNNRILSTWDFVDNNDMVYDDHYHGTMVLSVIGGNIPGELIGTAPHASFHLLRPEDAPTEYIIEEYNWASAAEYADSVGADIINSSLGYTRFDDPNQDHSFADLDGNTTPITRAADMAASKGMVVCNSAGNEGNSPWFRISAPADADSILAVGAVDASSTYVTFSGKGPSYDGRVKPDIAAQGQQTLAANPWGGGNVVPANGTSFSSPLIAGMVATLWQCNPNATNMEIINAIRQSASQANNPDSLLGYGIPDFPMACMLLAGLNPGTALNSDMLFVEGNPFTNQLNFSVFTTMQQNANILVTDLLGKVVYDSKHPILVLTKNQISVSAESFSKGIYLLEVTTENKRLVRKVIKQ